MTIKFWHKYRNDNAFQTVHNIVLSAIEVLHRKARARMCVCVCVCVCV